ncbi:MAG: TPM domain-containing protein [Ignavibacteria bacterium]|nr:TPM domain-containing protein [Ignavibacteria bacterium]
MERLIYKFFSDDDFLRISNQIKKAEKTTSGEIRISMKEKRQFADRSKTIRQLAEKEFYKLNMNSTRDKTGILLFLLLEEHQFYILADQGINEKVTQETWDSVRDEIQIKFHEGNFCDGMIAGIEKVGKILTEHFPVKADDANELSNKIVMER